MKVVSFGTQPTPNIVSSQAPDQLKSAIPATAADQVSIRFGGDKAKIKKVMEEVLRHPDQVTWRSGRLDGGSASFEFRINGKQYRFFSVVSSGIVHEISLTNCSDGT